MIIIYLLFAFSGIRTHAYEYIYHTHYIYFILCDEKAYMILFHRLTRIIIIINNKIYIYMIYDDNNKYVSMAEWLRR